MRLEHYPLGGNRDREPTEVVAFDGELVRSLLFDSGSKRGAIRTIDQAHWNSGPDVNPYSLIFGPAVDLQFSLRNTALLLVDAQRLTCDPAHGLGRMARERGELAVLAEYYQRVERALPAMSQLLRTTPGERGKRPSATSVR